MKAGNWWSEGRDKIEVEDRGWRLVIEPSAACDGERKPLLVIDPGWLGLTSR